MNPAPPVTTTHDGQATRPVHVLRTVSRVRRVPASSSRRPTSAPRERALLLDAFDSNWIAPLGPHVDAFEREFADVRRRAAARPRCRAAPPRCTSRCVLLGVGPGDDVLVPTLTFVATANAVAVRRRPPGVRRQRRAPPGTSIPRWSTRSSPTACRAGRAQPAALIGVDLYGQCADYDPILASCARVRRAGDRGRGRGARARPTAAGRRARSARSTCSRSTATRSSPRAAAGCSSADDPASIERARHLPRRRAIRRRTTSTPRSGSTTG